MGVAKISNCVFFLYVSYFFRYITNIEIIGGLIDWVSRRILSANRFFALSLAFGLILMLAPLVAAVSNPDNEKNSAYECGFEPFENARLKFDVRFYLVAILFVIFDLEVAFSISMGSWFLSI